MCLSKFIYNRYMCGICVCAGACGCQKQALDYLELEMQTVVSQHLDAGNQT